MPRPELMGIDIEELRAIQELQAIKSGRIALKGAQEIHDHLVTGEIDTSPSYPSLSPIYQRNTNNVVDI